LTALVSWDHSLFDKGAVATVYLLNSSNTQNISREQVLESHFADFSYEADNLGDLNFNINKTWLNGSSTLNVTFFLEVESHDHTPENNTIYHGPWIILTDKNATNTTASSDSGSGTSKSKKIGEGVGIPVGLIAFVALAVIAFILWRRHGQNKKGYGASKSLAQGTEGAGAARGHNRQGSFHDEPTRGVELQERNGGDNWGWGSPVGSPTSRQSNAFRDEISRQQTGRAR